TVTRPGPDARREVDINLRNVGIAQVIDGEGVGAPEGPELNVLDIVEIHADAGNIAGEQRVPAFGGDVDDFVDIRAIEQERIGIIAAVDDIAAVARIPDEGIVAGAKLRIVVAATAGDGVVVIAAIAVDHEFLRGPDVERERRRADAVEAHAGAIGRYREVFGAVSTVDLGGAGVITAFEQIGSITRIPDHAVVTGFTENLIVAGAAGQRVIAAAAEELVVAALA